MTAEPTHAPEQLLILAWRRRDTELTVDLLARENLPSVVCDDVGALCRHMEEHGAGGVIVAEEALTDAAVGRIAECLARQPPWSDFPILIFTGSRTRDAELDDRWARLGNVTLLERPVRVRAMVASVQAALRARRRQYDARRAIEARDRFLAMLGHELRNPLAAVRLASSLLGRSSEPAVMEHHRAVIDRQTHHLSRLIDDLLDVARVTYGKVALQPEPLRLDDIIRSCCQSLEQTIRESGLMLRLSLDSAISIRGDRVRLEQIFANLLHNAIKYTPRSGSIELSARAESGSAVVRVRDSGIGLSDEALQHVFDLFAQVDTSLDRAQGGLGIGLTLVRSLVQLHGGTVHAKSAGLGLGSEFRVELPLTLPSQVGEVSSRDVEPSAPARVVLVEDGDDIRELLKELLELEGHAVFTAADGPAGVARILEVQPDIAFVDIGLPDFDGYEVARQVRANGSRALLVALTGYGQEGDRMQAVQAGFDRHMTKPIDLRELHGTMTGLAGSRRSREGQVCRTG